MPSDQPRSEAGGQAGDRLVLHSGLIDLIAGIALTSVAALFHVVAATFDEVDNTGTGPATFPKGIAILIGVTSTILAVRGLLALLAPAGSSRVTVGRPWAVAAGIGLVCAFPLMMTTLGYHPAIAIWLPAFLLVAGYRKPIGILLYTAGFMAFAKIAFEAILGVRLP